jgi:hypothetical protein
MTHNMPANGTVLTQDEYGRPVLPKGAERLYGKPGKNDKIGYYLNGRSGEVETVPYRMPEPKRPAKAPKGGASSAACAGEAEVAVKLRPDVTQKGLAMIGDFRTDALHQALDDETIPTETLVGLLVLALGAKNVSVQSGHMYGEREAIRDRISEGGVITADPAVPHAAARAMLKLVLSCRANMTDSGLSSRVAGETLGAAMHLPSMATEEFLSCLSRQAFESSATDAGVKLELRVKDTRAALVKHFHDQTWRFPGAAFTLTEEERADASTRNSYRVGEGYRDPDAQDGPDDAAGFGEDDLDDIDADEHEPEPYPAAAA